MKKVLKYVVLPILVCVLNTAAAAITSSVNMSYPQTAKEVHGNPMAPRLIAHAGGAVYGIRLTNSLQALENSYSLGFRFFELDFCNTSDGIPVIVHDWGNANWFMNVKYSTKAPLYKEYKSKECIMDLNLMDLKMLEKWLLDHPDAFIITDMKDDNLVLLNRLNKNHGKIKDQIIPQIYAFEEYEPVKELGYKNIILTLYRLKAPADVVVEFCRNNQLFALTISSTNAVPDILEKYSGLGIPVYVHTINDYNSYVKLRDNNAYGVYTDYFQPLNWIE